MNQDKEYLYRKEISKLKKEVASLHHQLDVTKQNLERTLQSKSWKVTEPLRKVSSLRRKKEDFVSSPSLNSYDYHEVEPYISEYQENIDFQLLTPSVKTIAFYLPQYHAIPENDKWWGKGFTEWTNTRKSEPLFDGHYMPREPHDDFGYYCLENVETLKKQVVLAKQHGIYGFAFYYYWFSGKRLLEKPLDMLLQHPEIDMPFVLCWANENWTRTWDGLEKEILMEQKYTREDPYHFIEDLKKYMEDSRYIKIDNKPVIMVYNPSAIPDFETVCAKWREAAQELGIGEILIWSKTDMGLRDDSRTSYVDAEFDFAPHGFTLPNDKITGIPNASNVVNYSRLAHALWESYETHYPLRPFHYSVTMGWDNSARRKNGYAIFYHYSLEAFYVWTTMVIQKLHRNNFENTFLFVNAWNEWAEGTYLEPDKKYGYANINTLSKAIYNIPFEADFKVLNQKRRLRQAKKIAVQCHVYYVDLLPEMLEQIKNIPESFDLYITTDTKEKKKEIVQILKEHKLSNYFVHVYENRGRDILPMLLQMKGKIQNYDYLLHLHTKKSTTTSYGSNWREYLLHHLLGSKDNVKEIIYEFERCNDLGLVYPIPFREAFDHLVIPNGSIGRNRKNLEKLFARLDIPESYISTTMTFPVGSMFWCKTSAIKELFELVDEADFDLENGQLDVTYAHAVERSFDALARKNGYRSLEIYNLHD